MKKARKQFKIIVSCSVATIIAVALLFLLEYNSGNKINSEVTENDNFEITNLNIDFDSKSGASFRALQSGFFISTKDGAMFYDKNGNKIWGDTYSFESPIVTGRGNYTAVYDGKGFVLNVYDNEKFLYTINDGNKIENVSLNNNGYVTVIFRRSDGFFTSVYDKTGTSIFERIDQTEGIYPIVTDITSDGKIMVSSYVDTNGLEVVTKLVFYYTSESKEIDFEDNIFAYGKDKKDEVIVYIKYTENDGLLAFSDKSIYFVDKNGDELWGIDCEDTINMVCLSGKDYFVVSYGYDTNDSKSSNAVVWYNYEGVELSRFSNNKKVDYLESNGDATIFSQGRKFFCYSKGGKKMWEYSADVNVLQMLPIDNISALIVTSDMAAIFKSL